MSLCHKFIDEKRQTNYTNFVVENKESDNHLLIQLMLPLNNNNTNDHRSKYLSCPSFHSFLSCHVQSVFYSNIILPIIVLNMCVEWNIQYKYTVSLPSSDSKDLFHLQIQMNPLTRILLEKRNRLVNHETHSMTSVSWTSFGVSSIQPVCWRTRPKEQTVNHSHKTCQKLT